MRRHLAASNTWNLPHIIDPDSELNLPHIIDPDSDLNLPHIIDPDSDLNLQGKYLHKQI